MDHIPCPRGAHPLKMKQLRPVRLTPPSQKQKEDMKVDGKGTSDHLRLSQADSSGNFIVQFDSVSPMTCSDLLV